MQGEENKKEKIWKNLQNKSKHKNNKCFSWVTAVRVLSLTGSHSPPHLPRLPSSTVFISGPAVGAAQILIWPCVFSPPVSTAIRTNVFLFIIARTWKQPSCPSAGEWIRKLWYIYTMEYYSVIKKKTFESVLMRWMKLEPIILSEASQKDKHQQYTNAYIWNFKRW